MCVCVSVSGGKRRRGRGVAYGRRTIELLGLLGQERLFHTEKAAARASAMTTGLAASATVNRVIEALSNFTVLL